MDGLKKVIKEGGKIADPDEKPKWIVVGRGLCWHLYQGYEAHTIFEETILPTAECGLCKKKYIYSRELSKFVET